MNINPESSADLLRQLHENLYSRDIRETAGESVSGAASIAGIGRAGAALPSVFMAGYRRHRSSDRLRGKRRLQTCIVARADTAHHRFTDIATASAPAAGEMIGLLTAPTTGPDYRNRGQQVHNRYCTSIITPALNFGDCNRYGGHLHPDHPVISGNRALLITMARNHKASMKTRTGSPVFRQPLPALC